MSPPSERVPGDGEDYDADWGVDDDEAIDGIDEDIADDSSGGEDCQLGCVNIGGLLQQLFINVIATMLSHQHCHS